MTGRCKTTKVRFSKLPVFIAASVVSRGLRFFVVAGLLYFFGPPIKSFIERYLGWVFAAGLAVLFLGFLGVKYP